MKKLHEIFSQLANNCYGIGKKIVDYADKSNKSEEEGIQKAIAIAEQEAEKLHCNCQDEHCSWKDIVVIFGIIFMMGLITICVSQISQVNSFKKFNTENYPDRVIELELQVEVLRIQINQLDSLLYEF